MGMYASSTQYLVVVDVIIVVLRFSGSRGEVREVT